MRAIPRESAPDSTLALARDPYGFIADGCRRHGSDVFEARIMLQRTIFLSGAEAAALFYDPERFRRSGATPGRFEKTLFGRGGVQGFDGEAHRHRKRMFMSLMTSERIEALGGIAGRYWQDYARDWQNQKTVVLYPQVQELLCRAVCNWAGVPLAGEEVQDRTSDLSALYEQAGSLGPKHWRARLARHRAERWAAGVIAAIRAGRLETEPDGAARVIAWHRELDDQLLSHRVAAVELLNILRPTVAVSVFITFVALALHEYPAARDALKGGDNGYVEPFVQEVRRFYPFFPAVAARVRRDFQWHGYSFTAGRRALLDLYGTNHDAAVWDDPYSFSPERFLDRETCAFDFIPQGGGDHYLGHRCPGEWIAMELMKVAVHYLGGRLRYRVPKQDLSIDQARLPALPRSGFVIRDVRLL